MDRKGAKGFTIKSTEGFIMGYCMTIMGDDFIIKRDQHAGALAAIKALAGDETITDSSGKHYRWTDTQEFLKATSLKDAMAAWRWHIEDSSILSGDIIGIDFWGEKMGDDIILFKAIAPYVVKNSYIQMNGEDGCIWRWVFDGTTCKEVEAQITF